MPWQCAPTYNAAGTQHASRIGTARDVGAISHWPPANLARGLPVMADKGAARSVVFGHPRRRCPTREYGIDSLSRRREQKCFKGKANRWPGWRRSGLRWLGNVTPVHAISARSPEHRERRRQSRTSSGLCLVEVKPASPTSERQNNEQATRILATTTSLREPPGAAQSSMTWPASNVKSGFRS